MDDDYVAYCLNQAVTYVGKLIESEMETAGSKAKTAKAAEAARSRVLDKYLSKGSGNKKPQFMDPALMMGS